MHATQDGSGALRDLYACVGYQLPTDALADHSVAQLSAHMHRTAATVAGAAPLDSLQLSLLDWVIAAAACMRGFKHLVLQFACFCEYIRVPAILPSIGIMCLHD